MRHVWMHIVFRPSRSIMAVRRYVRRPVLTFAAVRWWYNNGIF
jgi:hypothetical protein